MTPSHDSAPPQRHWTELTLLSLLAFFALASVGCTTPYRLEVPRIDRQKNPKLFEVFEQAAMNGQLVLRGGTYEFAEEDVTLRVREATTASFAIEAAMADEATITGTITFEPSLDVDSGDSAATISTIALDAGTAREGAAIIGVHLMRSLLLHLSAPLAPNSPTSALIESAAIPKATISLREDVPLGLPTLSGRLGSGNRLEIQDLSYLNRRDGRPALLSFDFALSSALKDACMEVSGLYGCASSASAKWSGSYAKDQDSSENLLLSAGSSTQLKGFAMTVGEETSEPASQCDQNSQCLSGDISLEMATPRPSSEHNEKDSADGNLVQNDGVSLVRLRDTQAWTVERGEAKLVVSNGSARLRFADALMELDDLQATAKVDIAAPSSELLLAGGSGTGFRLKAEKFQVSAKRWNFAALALARSGLLEDETAEVALSSPTASFAGGEGQVKLTGDAESRVTLTAARKGNNMLTLGGTWAGLKVTGGKEEASLKKASVVVAVTSISPLVGTLDASAIGEVAGDEGRIGIELKSVTVSLQDSRLEKARGKGRLSLDLRDLERKLRAAIPNGKREIGRISGAGLRTLTVLSRLIDRPNLGEAGAWGHKLRIFVRGLRNTRLAAAPDGSMAVRGHFDVKLEGTFKKTHYKTKNVRNSLGMKLPKVVSYDKKHFFARKTVRVGYELQLSVDTKVVPCRLQDCELVPTLKLVRFDVGDNGIGLLDWLAKPQLQGRMEGDLTPLSLFGALPEEQRGKMPEVSVKELKFSVLGGKLFCKFELESPTQASSSPR